MIADAVDALPDEVEDWVPAAATRFLLDKAGEHDAKDLRILGRRVLEVVDPEAADAEEARRLEAEEADALAEAWLTLFDDGHGTCHGRFAVPSLHGAMLGKDLKARVAREPRRHERQDEASDRRDWAKHRLGLALPGLHRGARGRRPRRVAWRRRSS